MRFAAEDTRDGLGEFMKNLEWCFLGLSRSSGNYQHRTKPKGAL